MTQRENEQPVPREALAAVREACVNAALTAYEEAGIHGLCAEGRWECAVAAMRAIDLDAILAATTRKHAT